MVKLSKTVYNQFVVNKICLYVNFYFSNETVPTDYKALDSIDIFVLNKYPINQLSKEQINALSRQVSQCESERSQFETELRNSEQRKAELQQAINSAKSPFRKQTSSSPATAAIPSIRISIRASKE